MRTVALASGSNGNCVYVETDDARLLFDAGISGKLLAARAASCDVDLTRLDALLLSHDHSDHVCGAGVAHRRFGPRIFASRGTWAASRQRIGAVSPPGLFRAGEAVAFGKTIVTTIPTPHDGRDGVAFVVESRGVRLGVLTDLGHPFAELQDVAGTLDAAYIEANYDPRMLEKGPYPYHLKQRIAGDGGHLSNEECVSLARDAGAGRLRTLVLCHLSGENNSPETALDAAAHLGEHGLRVLLAPRHGPSQPFTLEAS